MRALYFDTLPSANALAPESESDAPTVLGARVHTRSFLEALLQYGTYDQYCFPATSSARRRRFVESSLYERYRHRIQFIDTWNPSPLKRSSRLVFYRDGTSVSTLLWFRRRLGKRDTPVVGRAYSLNYDSTINNIALALLAPVQSFDALVCPSRAGADVIHHMMRIVRSRMAEACGGAPERALRTPIIPYGIDVTQFAPQARTDALVALLRRQLRIALDDVVLLYVGRFSPYSKADLSPLMIAFQRLRADGQTVRLIVAGDDHQLHCADQLRQTAAALGCAESVSVLPNPSEVIKRALYRAADIFVSPSDNIQETAGLTILEAGASHLPVVASDWNGYRDCVDDGRTGFLVPTYFPSHADAIARLRGDCGMRDEDLLASTTMVDVAALQAALSALVVNPCLRRQMGEAGAARVAAHHHQEAIIAANEALWEELASEARATTLPTSPEETRAEPLLPYDEVFAHYATRPLRGDDTVVASPPGGRWLESMEASPWWQSELAHRLITVSADAEAPTTIADLVAAVDADQWMNGVVGVRAHIARLIKYGHFSLV